jgi:CheY-like chemotaxis protein
MIPTATRTSQEALSLVRSGERFDAAILEMDMPKLSGLALGKAIRKYNKTMPLLMLTFAGWRIESDLFLATLTKPIKPSQLYNVLIDIMSRKSISEPIPSPLEEVSKHSSLKVLLAEDNIYSQKVTLQMLKKLGFRADVVANGLEVLQSVERQHYDIILMDVRMPEMNGLEATEIIRQRWPEKKPLIIAVTAYGLDGDREKCLKAGMDDYISKPIKLDDLKNMLHKYILPQSWEKASSKRRKES